MSQYTYSCWSLTPPRSVARLRSMLQSCPAFYLSRHLFRKRDKKHELRPLYWKCLAVGNIPYDATEEQLVHICEEVGPVVNFRYTSLTLVDLIMSRKCKLRLQDSSRHVSIPYIEFYFGKSADAIHVLLLSIQSAAIN